MNLILRLLIAGAITSALGTGWAFWTGAGRSGALLSWALALLPLLWLALAVPTLRAGRSGRAVAEVALGLLGWLIAPVLYPASYTGTGSPEIIGFFLWPFLPMPDRLFGVPFATLNAWLWAPRLAALSILLPLAMMGLRWNRVSESKQEHAVELKAEAVPVGIPTVKILEEECRAPKQLHDKPLAEAEEHKLESGDAHLEPQWDEEEDSSASTAESDETSENRTNVFALFERPGSEIAAAEATVQNSKLSNITDLLNRLKAPSAND